VSNNEGKQRMASRVGQSKRGKHLEKQYHNKQLHGKQHQGFVFCIR